MRWIVAGLCLGVLSRVEETTSGFSAGISSNGMWAIAAVAAGAAGRRVHPAIVVLTAANLGFYAWIAATEPATDLAAVAGNPLRWLVLGVAGGAVFGWTGKRLREEEREPVRVLLSLPLAATLLAEATDGLRTTDAFGLIAGVAVPVLSARTTPGRLLGAAVAGALVAAGTAGLLAPVNPGRGPGPRRSSHHFPRREPRRPRPLEVVSPEAPRDVEDLADEVEARAAA
jgi:hypothetical protein